MVEPLTGLAIIGTAAFFAVAGYLIGKMGNGGNTKNKDSPEIEKTPREDLVQSSDFLDRYKRLVDLSQDAMQIYFDLIIKPEHLKQTLQNNKARFEKNNAFSPDDLNKLYPVNKDPTSGELDITLMYKILRNAGLIPAPNNGWGKDPKFNHQSLSDYIERIRLQRNYSDHLRSKTMDRDEFILRATEISLAIIKLSNYKLKKEVMKDGYIWRNTKTIISMEIKNEQEVSNMNDMCENVVTLLQSYIDLLSENSTPEEVQDTLTYVENQLDDIKKEDLPFISNEATKKVDKWIKKHKDGSNPFILKSCLELTKTCAMKYKAYITKASVGSIILLMHFSNLEGFMEFLEDCGNGNFVESVNSLICSDPTFKQYQKKSIDVICHTELYVNMKESATHLLKETTAKLTRRKSVCERTTTIKSKPGQQCMYKPSQTMAYLRPGRRSDRSEGKKELLSS